MMTSGNPLRCSAVTVRTDALKAEGGFNDRLRYVVDWDCWLRLSRKWSVSWLARPTVQIRWHSASETHRFKAGQADLDETADMLRTLFEGDLKDVPDIAQLRAAAQDRLARAFLNRAHDALRLGMPDVARNALFTGLEYSPRLIKTILADPRLSVSMAALALAPGVAARLFSRRTN